MSATDFSFVLREEPGLDPMPPRFNTSAWLKMADAEVVSAATNGSLAHKLGDFVTTHRGESFVWDAEMDYKWKTVRKTRS